jgi:hypothetical protein
VGSSIGELKGWAPEIEDLATATRRSATNHSGAAEFYRSLSAVSTWQGQGAEAARTAMDVTAAYGYRRDGNSWVYEGKGR